MIGEFNVHVSLQTFIYKNVVGSKYTISVATQDKKHDTRKTGKIKARLSFSCFNPEHAGTDNKKTNLGRSGLSVRVMRLQ